jgi:hypothetical protein
VRVWSNVAQDTDKWQVLVNTVLNLQLPQNVGNFFTSWKIIFSQKVLYSMELGCVHPTDNYILSPPPSAFSTVPVIISVLITICSCT